jgi:hypothetical protein
LRTSLRAGAIRSAAEDVAIVGPSGGHDAELMGAVALALQKAEIRV